MMIHLKFNQSLFWDYDRKENDEVNRFPTEKCKISQKISEIINFQLKRLMNETLFWSLY